jgi:2-methylcitrate dehydratase
VTTKDGKRHVREVEFPRGHAGNPMTDAEVEGKFRALAAGKMSERRQDRVLAALWKLEELTDVSGLLALFADGKVRG